MKTISIFFFLMSSITLFGFSDGSTKITRSRQSNGLLYQSFISQKQMLYGGYPKWRFALQGGFSYMNGSDAPDMTEELENYIDELRSGYNIGADVSYNFSKGLGFGLKYHLYKSSNELQNIALVDSEGNIFIGDISDNISVNFIAPAVYFRYIANRNHLLYLNFAMGLLSYNNDSKVGEPLTISGKNGAIMYEFGYDYIINEQIAVGLQFSYFAGALLKYEVSNGSQTQTFDANDEDVSGLDVHHLNASIGLRYYF